MNGRKNAQKFREDDPLRYLHVARRFRKNVDGGPGSDALGKMGTDTDDAFDREEVMNRGDVVPEHELQ